MYMCDHGCVHIYVYVCTGIWSYMYMHAHTPLRFRHDTVNLRSSLSGGRDHCIYLIKEETCKK